MMSVKHGLHFVVAVAQHACGRVLKRVLKLSLYRLQIFLVKYEYQPSLQLCQDQDIRGKLKNVFTNVLEILMTYIIETRF